MSNELKDNADFLAELHRWSVLSEQLADIKAQEIALRIKLFNQAFPMANIGTNTAALNEGWELKGKLTANKSIDKAELLTLQPEFKKLSIDVNTVFNWKPELSKTQYDKLNLKQKNQVDRVVTLKKGTPALEIILPTKYKDKIE